jgi:hypothetical protein
VISVLALEAVGSEKILAALGQDDGSVIWAERTAAN